MTAEIFLRDFVFDCFIGIHDFERGVRQRMQVNIVLQVKKIVPQRDELALVLDYDYLRLGVLDLVRERVFDTQEYLLGKIVDIAFSHTAVVGVLVETCKPDVYPDSAGVGCRLQLARDEYLDLCLQGAWLAE